MIALPQDLPLVEWNKRRNVPLSEGWLAESIQTSASKVGMEQWHWTEDVAKAISYYLQCEFGGTLITPEQLQVLIKKSLRSIGYPEIAKRLTLVAPRVSLHLQEMAARSHHELFFFKCCTNAWMKPAPSMSAASSSKACAAASKPSKIPRAGKIPAIP
ncbi:MAG: hypothetical protein HC904_03565 [Blastochloris sp.]|nr:hypothetical protein [Blastochloris sp.]